MPDAARHKLERQAAAVIERRRRSLSEKTVFGIFQPGPTGQAEHLYSLQEVNGEYVKTIKQFSIKVPKKLERFLTVQKRFKISFGGRSGAKSNTIADILFAHAKDYGDKTLCVREIQSSIEDSVHALLSSEIKRVGFGSFDITDKAIRFKGEDVFKFKGLYRNPDAVKSMFGFKRGWGEEAQALSFDSIEMLTPTVRTAGSELWFSMNPGSSADPMSQRFLKPFYKQLLRDGYYEDDLHLIIWINYDDNPWHMEGPLELEREYDKNNLSPAAYRHKWLGFYNDEVENSIIPVEHFDAAIDAHVKLGFKGEGAIIAAHDPSDEGPDDKGYALRHGSVVLDVEANPDGDANAGMDWALDKAIAANADWFTWDCDGLGISLKRQVSTALKGKKIDYFLFKGSESPEFPNEPYIKDDDDDSKKRKTNKETLVNKRAQYSMRLANRFAATYRAVVKKEYVDPDEMISLSSDITCLDELRAETCRIPLKPNNNGKIQIMSKIEMAKPPLSLPSPNLFDSLMMLMYCPMLEEKSTTMNFSGWRG